MFGLRRKRENGKERKWGTGRAAARDAEASAAAAAAVSVAATSSSKMKKKERAWVYFLCLVLSLSLCACVLCPVLLTVCFSLSLGASLRPALNCWLCLLLYRIEASYSSRLPREKGRGKENFCAIQPKERMKREREWRQSVPIPENKEGKRERERERDEKIMNTKVLCL